MKRNIKSIILAGGKGERMQSDIPKVLHLLSGRPLLLHVIDNLKKAGTGKAVIVVGYKGEEVKEAAGAENDYAWQYEQLGGWAGRRPELEKKAV